jgi:hypothetical protein
MKTNVTKHSRVSNRIIDAYDEIKNNQTEKIDFLHTVLCQVGMPRKKTEGRVFERKSGTASIRLESGALFQQDQWVEQPLPYGAKPRLIMVYISTEAVRTRNREIEVGHSVHDFMKTLGFDTNSRAYNVFKKQAMALAACHMSLGFSPESNPKTVYTRPIEQFDAWLHSSGQNGQKCVLWPGSIKLSDSFFNTLVEFSVPLDHRAIAAIGNSALALDVYSWLAQRLCRIDRREGVAISWANLKDQFGQEYINIDSFKQEFKKSLLQVYFVYPDSRIEQVQDGLILKSSPPPITKTKILIPSSSNLMKKN